MWNIKTAQLLVFVICTNYAEATYNSGIKTKSYEPQPISQVHHHPYPEYENRHANQPTQHGLYNQYRDKTNDRDYQATLTNHNIGTDNSYQQQHDEGEAPEQTQLPYQPIYERRETPPTQTVNWQNSENTITEYYTGCPSGHTGQLPYAYDCRRFLNCWHGRGHIQTCSVGTVFNPESLECDRPDKVKCETALGVLGVQAVDKPQQTPSHGSIKQPKHNAGRYTDATDDSVEVLCPIGAEGLQPHPTDCTRFINCANGNMHIQQCGPGTAYSIPMKVCDFKSKVDCSGREGDVAASTPNQQVKNKISCPADVSGLQPHPTDCTKFLQCANGETFIQDCGPGTAFDSIRLICDYKHKVQCCSGCSSWSELPVKNKISCPADVSGLQPHPTDCTKFLQCANGETFIQDCGPGTAFDSIRLICDYKHKVQCCSGCSSWSEIETTSVSGNIHTQTAEHKRPSSTSSTSHTPEEDLPHTADILCINGITGLFPYPFDYTKFINCRNGNTAIQNCVPNTAFSISKGYCEPLDEIQKSDHVMYIVSQVSHEYSQTLITCPPGTEGLHLYPFNAELFVKCIQSQMRILPCRNANVFSVTRRTCLPHNQVLKHERVRLLTELQSTSSYRVTDENYSLKNMVLCPGAVSGTYPHPFDSTKYLKCVQGRLMSESCASGHAFSLSRKICSLKEEINANDYVGHTRPSNQGQEWRTTNMEVTHGSIDGLTYLMCPPGASGYFLHPFDCTKYIECRQGATAVDNCNNGAIFSISRKECIPRDKVEAYDRVEYMTTTNNEFTSDQRENQELGISCNAGTFGVYPHPQDCHKYIRCANGRLSSESCPAGQVFSAALRSCHNENEGENNDRNSYNRGFSITQSDFKAPVTGTLNSVNIPQPGFNPSPTPSEFVNLPAIALRPPLPTSQNFSPHNDVACPPGATGRYPHPFDCTKFLMCANGKTHIQDCGPGTAWNKKMEVCDFKERVGCSTNTATAHRCPAGVEGLYQHPYDWHKYLVCSNGATTVMDCAPGTVFSLSRKTCDLEANVANSDRCNNGIYVSGYDYGQEQTFNNRDQKQYNHGATAPQQWPMASSSRNPTTTQTTENRWTNMNMPRPHGSTYDHDRTPVWTGSGVHVDQHNPTHTVIFEEGSFEPNRNYNRPMYSYSTPLAPLKPTTTINTASTVVYAQPVGSQEDSKEIFSPAGQQPSSVHNPQYFPISNRQNHTTQTNTWTPIRPVGTPTHNLNHPYPGTVYTNGRLPVPSASYPAPSIQYPQTSWPASTSNSQQPAARLSPPTGNDDSGQKPLLDSEFRLTNINIDQLPGQSTYNLDDFDQLPAGSAKHNAHDDSNLYNGLQPPFTQTTTTTTAKSFPQTAYADTTQVPPPLKPTFPTHTVRIYPQLSNATIQTFPHQPHYSPPYAEVAHSRNASWVGRKLPQHSAIKPTHRDRDPSNSENLKGKQRNTSASQIHSSYSNNENEETDPATDDQEAAMKAALKLLLKPYLDSESKADDNVAEQAKSHIMNLVSNSDKYSTTTSTHIPFFNKNTLVPSTTPPQEDVELIIAGEQHHLVGVSTTQAGDHESSRSYSLNHTPLQPAIPKTHDHNHNPNWHRHHNHGAHNFKLQHSREFHKKHPNLPNPFDDPVNSHNPLAEGTTTTNYDIDVRAGGRCPFDCGNGKCVEQHQICDGVNNCGNRRDERQCEHLGYELRLTGGESSHMGRVEVKILGQWGYVCDDKFGLRDADVVCRELGFKMGAMEVRGSSYYAPSDVNINFVMDEVECSGNETSLKECNFKGWGVNNCGPDEVVGVVCKVPKLKCPDNYWLCSTSKECIPTAFLCDVTPDCSDGTDESEEVCNAPIQYRLEGGRGSNEGRLEVFYRGEWGTVCDDDFGLKEAQVLCNSFGLYGKPQIVKNIYGPGSGPIWLDQVSCLGNETKLDECNHWSWGENNCNHTEDVGIKCIAGPKPIISKVRKASTDDASDQYQDLELTLQLEQSELDDLGLYQGLWQRSSKAVQAQKKCGHFKANLIDEYEHPEERVVNGTIAKRGRHPWQATIRTRGRGGISSHWCGAVIISRKLVLTAAHCLAGYPKGSYFVRMGDHYANIAESSEIDSNIENWYIHEKFRDQKHMNNDIALILLKHPVRFNDYVQPVCLPEKGTVLETNRMCTISGWGSIKSGTSTPSNILRSAQVPILGDEVCSQKNVYANAMTEGMFCAGFLDESADACDGDSGGPLVCSDEDAETLHGIISWGQHCGYANHPGVYVRVEKYIDWIYEKINLMMQQGKL